MEKEVKKIINDLKSKEQKKQLEYVLICSNCGHESIQKSSAKFRINRIFMFAARYNDKPNNRDCPLCKKKNQHYVNAINVK